MKPEKTHTAMTEIEQQLDHCHFILQCILEKYKIDPKHLSIHLEATLVDNTIDSNGLIEAAKLDGEYQPSQDLGEQFIPDSHSANFLINSTKDYTVIVVGDKERIW